MCERTVPAGETAGVPASPTAGGFEVDELYGELVIPLMSGQRGAERLDISLASRYSDYDLFGSDTVSKIGVNWAPTENLLFRASFSEGLRAPNIGELFNTGSRFDAGINDPCSNAMPEDVANCTALGVPIGFVSPNPQTSVSTGGNINLVPETADTINLGVVWNVPVDSWGSVDNFSIEANYYDIEIDKAIQAPNAQDLLNRCTDTLDPLFCDPITRTVNGTVTRVDGILSNIGGIETSGFDLTLRMDFTETDYGQFSVEWVSTFLDDFIEITEGPDGPISTDRAGFEIGSPERGYLETKSTLNTDWYMNDWDVRLSLRYLSSLTEACGGLLPDFELTDRCSNDPATNELKSRLYTDLQVGYRPSNFGDGKWAFQVGVDNLFDENVPYCYSCDLNTFDGTLYPIPGQVVYARATFEL